MNQINYNSFSKIVVADVWYTISSCINSSSLNRLPFSILTTSVKEGFLKGLLATPLDINARPENELLSGGRVRFNVPAGSLKNIQKSVITSKVHLEN